MTRARSTWRWAALAVAALAAVLTGVVAERSPSDPAPSARAPATTPATTPAVTPTAAAGIDVLLGRVRVVERRPQVPGYDRDCGPGDGCVFGTEWSDDTGAPDAHNGCDTRNDVLREQLLDVAVKTGTRGCDVVAGRLVDPYTGASIDYATRGSTIHVDHLVALAAAWDLGAATWSAARRAAFANDTSLELIAVAGSANLSKGDSTPASWLPPRRAFRCEFVTRYLTVAVAYDLAVTAADVEVIGFVQRRSC